MKEYIDYLTERSKIDIEYFTVFNDTSIRIGMKPMLNSVDKLVFISEMIKDLKSIKSINMYEIEIEDFDNSEGTSILLKVIK
ncbi:MAG TPA: hypothetical protein PLY35_12425 [Thermotogota bacterium]|nr:hypothetical protein [Thermotogota bacterium]